MEPAKLTFTSVEPQDMPTGVFAAWVATCVFHADYVAQVLADPYNHWDTTHGCFYLGSDGAWYVAYDDLDFCTLFASFDGTAWTKLTGTAWVRPARALVRLRRDLGAL